MPSDFEFVFVMPQCFKCKYKSFKIFHTICGNDKQLVTTFFFSGRRDVFQLMTIHHSVNKQVIPAIIKRVTHGPYVISFMQNKTGKCILENM